MCGRIVVFSCRWADGRGQQPASDLRIQIISHYRHAYLLFLNITTAQSILTISTTHLRTAAST